MRTTTDQHQPDLTGLARSLTKWFRASARDLPWRDQPLGTHRDPYRVLVSETMLQQTQVSRVMERYNDFLAAFPTAEALAHADEDRVLELWSGMGYYQRARRLQAAAKALVDAHNGVWPTEPPSLMTLPGVGRYTAGAIASLAFGVRTPLADGNVARVLLRVHGREGSLNDPKTMRWVWERADALVKATPARTPVALLNEGLMELGATLCTPKAPKCEGCPWRGVCVAERDGLVDAIPAPKKAAEKKMLWCASLLVRDDTGRCLVEKRPSAGLWSGLWQAPTLETTERLTSRAVALAFGLGGGLRRVEAFSFATTHRDVRFEVWSGNDLPADRKTTWKSLEQIERLGLSTPQRRILLRTAQSQPDTPQGRVTRRKAGR